MSPSSNPSLDPPSPRVFLRPERGNPTPMPGTMLQGWHHLCGAAGLPHHRRGALHQMRGITTGRVPRASGKLDFQTPNPIPSGSRDPPPPGQWSSHPTQGKGTGKGMSYTNASRGKGMTPGKGLSTGKGSSTGKGGVQMLTSDQKAPPLVNTSGRKCGYCHSQGRDGNHDFLTCNFRNEDREPNHTE